VAVNNREEEAVELKEEAKVANNSNKEAVKVAKVVITTTIIVDVTLVTVDVVVVQLIPVIPAAVIPPIGNPRTTITLPLAEMSIKVLKAEPENLADVIVVSIPITQRNNPKRKKFSPKPQFSFPIFRFQ